MATKAEQFRTQRRRSKGRKPKTVRARRDVPVDTAAPGVSATDRKAGIGSTAARNRSARAGRKGGAALEDSAGPRASRRSSRRSSDRTKRDDPLHQRSVQRTLKRKRRPSRG
jgi:hypothetical protein